MKNSWIWVLVAVVVIGGIVWWGSMHKTAPVGDTYKIGVILPLTGDAASYGEPAQQIYQMAVDEINTAGGINGKPMQLIVEDGKCDGQDAASAAQKLINVDQVQVIVGGFCSGESLAAEPIAAQAKVALFSPGSSSPKLTGISPYFARNYPSDSAQGKVLADIAYNDKGWKNIAFIQEQTDYAAGIESAFSTEFEKLGGKIIDDQQFPTETTDFRSIVSKVQSENPDALFVDTQTPASGARVLTQIQQLGWKPHLLVSDVIIGDAPTVSQYQGILEGALGAEFGVDESNPKFVALENNYKAKYGTDLPHGSYAQTEYDGMYLVRDAIAAAGYDGTAIANWFHTDVQNWQGAAGSVTISPDGDPVAGHRPEVIMAGKVLPYTK